MFLKTFLESYWVVLSYLRHGPAAVVDPKERIRKIASFGSRMHKLREIAQREAAVQVTFENALEFFASQGIKGPADREAMAF